MDEPAVGNGALTTRLIDALRLMALPADEQIAALPAFVQTADEIALTFDDVYRTIDAHPADGSMSDSQLAALREIDQALQSMSQPPEGATVWTDEALAVSAWTRDALRTDGRWALLRDRALSLLTLMGATPGLPQMLGTIYVAEDAIWAGSDDSSSARPPSLGT